MAFVLFPESDSERFCLCATAKGSACVGSLDSMLVSAVSSSQANAAKKLRGATCPSQFFPRATAKGSAYVSSSWCRRKKRENISKHVYVNIGCSLSLESLLCASAWHSVYPRVTPRIHWTGLRLLSRMPTEDHLFMSVFN